MELKILTNFVKNLILLIDILNDEEKRKSLVTQLKGLVFLIDREENEVK